MQHKQQLGQGIKKRTARSQGQRMLTNVDIIEAIICYYHVTNEP